MLIPEALLCGEKKKKMQPLDQPRGDRHVNYMVNFDIFSVPKCERTLKRCRVTRDLTSNSFFFFLSFFLFRKFCGFNVLSDTTGKGKG